MLCLLRKGTCPFAVINNHIIKAYGEVEIWLREFLTWILDGVLWFASRPGHFTPGKKAKWAIACLEALKKRKISCSRRVQNHDFSVI